MAKCVQRAVCHDKVIVAKQPNTIANNTQMRGLAFRQRPIAVRTSALVAPSAAARRYMFSYPAVAFTFMHASATYQAESVFMTLVRNIANCTIPTVKGII